MMSLQIHKGARNLRYILLAPKMCTLLRKLSSRPSEMGVLSEDMYYSYNYQTMLQPNNKQGTLYF